MTQTNSTLYRVRYPWQASKIHEYVGEGDDAPLLAAQSEPDADWIRVEHFDGEDAQCTLRRLQSIGQSCGINPEHIWIADVSQT